MKIIIRDENGQLVVNTESETGTSKSQIYATLSLALASMLAEPIQRKNIPPEAKKLLIDATAEVVAMAIKEDFAKIVASGTHGVSFYNKEAEFMRKVFDL